jgi:anionic cell wall polymer biosynthesis LytR-Cps2A-Psr (LCP) family protein
MKKLIALIVTLSALLSFEAKAQTVAAYGSLIATNAHTVSTNIVSTNLNFTTATFYASRSNAVNSGTVYIGTSSNFTLYPIAPNGELVITAPKSGQVLNLKNFWIRNASANDGLFVIYQ